jgi:hypothetical protein
VGGGSQFPSFLGEGDGRPFGASHGAATPPLCGDISAAKAVGGGSFADGSGAPLVGEASCSVWRHLQHGDMRCAAAVPHRGGEHAFLHGLTMSPS